MLSLLEVSSVFFNGFPSPLSPVVLFALLQEMSVAAIAATAVSAGESFLPYMAATCNMLGPLMTLQEENMLNVS